MSVIQCDPLNPIYSLDSFTLIKVSGADTNKFLQGQITINVDSIEACKLSLAAICNLKGRCIALFFATRINDDVLLILSADTAPNCIDTLKKYAVFFKVSISLVEDEYRLYGLTSNMNKQQERQEKMHLAQWPAKDITVLIVETQQQSLPTPLQNKHLHPETEWLAHLAQSGVAWLTGISANEFLPHNLNLAKIGGIDFKKGCFTGQEVIARMQYKGTLKSHMQQFIIRQHIAVDSLSSIYCGEKRAAQVICSAHPDKQTTVLLALAKDKYLAEENFRLADENGPILELVKAN